MVSVKFCCSVFCSNVCVNPSISFATKVHAFFASFFGNIRSHTTQGMHLCFVFSVLLNIVLGILFVLRWNPLPVRSAIFREETTMARKAVLSFPRRSLSLPTVSPLHWLKYDPYSDWMENSGVVCGAGSIANFYFNQYQYFTEEKSRYGYHSLLCVGKSYDAVSSPGWKASTLQPEDAKTELKQQQVGRQFDIIIFDVTSTVEDYFINVTQLLFLRKLIAGGTLILTGIQQTAEPTVLLRADVHTPIPMRFLRSIYTALHFHWWLHPQFNPSKTGNSYGQRVEDVELQIFDEFVSWVRSLDCAQGTCSIKKRKSELEKRDMRNM